MKILVVEPGKHPYTQEIRGDLASMQALVGGLIQAIYPFEEEVALICNEEGKLLSLQPNRVLREDNGRIYDVICGTFFLCAPRQTATLSKDSMQSNWSGIHSVSTLSSFSSAEKALVFNQIFSL